jgi:hypothetical protein
MVSLTSRTVIRIVVLTYCSIAGFDAWAGIVLSVAGTGNADDNNQLINYSQSITPLSQNGDLHSGQDAFDQNGRLSASSGARAQGNLLLGVLDPGLRLRTNAGSYASNIARANSWAVAQWADTIRITQNIHVADHLAVYFSIRGEYGYSREEPAVHDIGMTLGLANISYSALGESDPQAFVWANNLAFFPRPGDSTDPLISGTASLNLRRSSFGDSFNFFWSCVESLRF